MRSPTERSLAFSHQPRQGAKKQHPLFLFLGSIPLLIHHPFFGLFALSPKPYNTKPLTTWVGVLANSWLGGVVDQGMFRADWLQ